MEEEVATGGYNLLHVPVSAPTYLLVETAPRAHQLAKREFLAELKQRVIAGAAEELAGTHWTAEQCPYLEYWFACYETRSAESVEAALRKYLPGLGTVADASGYFDPAVARVRSSIAKWAGTGELDVPPAAVPEAIASSIKLGLGHPLDSATRSRFETAMGTDLSQIRVHADSPGASAASSENASAFAIGNHIAFAAGEHAPGTMRGDALLAHELAHTQQQSGPPSDGASAVHERAADRAATSIWSRLWSGVTGALAVAQTAGSVARTGLQLQRCPQTPKETEPEDFALDEPPDDIVVVTDPTLPMEEPGRGHARAVVGQKVAFSLNNKNAVVHNIDDGVLHAKEWAIFRPGEEKSSGRWNQVATKTIDFDKVGRWRIFYEGIYGDARPFASGITVDVISLDDAEKEYAAERNARITRETSGRRTGLTLGWVPFRAKLASQSISLARRGLKEQHLSSKQTWIDSDNKNPAEPSSNPIHYTVKPSPGATTFEWYATVDDPKTMPTDSYYGHARTIRDGVPVYTMNGNGTTSSFTLADPGVFYIWCDQFDAQHRLVDSVRYIQSVQTREEYDKGLGTWKVYIADVDKAHDKIEPGAGKQVEAVFVDTYTGRGRDLDIFIGPKAGSSKYLLLDLTAGAKRSEFEGDNLEDAVHTFDKKNKYPDGLIKIHASPSQTFSITTTGKSDLEQASHRTGQVSMTFLGLGLLAAVIPFAEPAAPYLLGMAGLSGAASGTLSLVDRLQQTHPDVSGVALDVVGIAASLIGSAQAVEQIVAKRAAKAAVAAGNAARGTAAKGSRFLMWAQFTTDAVGGLLISEQALVEIDELNKRTGLSDGQRIDAIVRILSQLALQGGMLAVSSKALAESQPRLRSALGDAELGRLKGNPNAPALALLDEPAINALRNVPAGDLDHVAELVALDPVTAESALATGKVKSAAELEKAITEGKIGDTPLADVRAPEKPATAEGKVPEPAKPVEEPTKPVEEPTKPVEPPTKPVEPAVKPAEKTAPPANDPGGRGEWAMDDAEIGDRLTPDEKADLRAKEAKTPETPEELEELVKLREKARGGPPAEVQVGSPEHALDRWKDYAKRPGAKYPFKRWMSGQASRMSNPVRGLKREGAYRTKIAKWFKDVKSRVLNAPASAKPRQADVVFQRPAKKGRDILQIKSGEESLTRKPRRSGGKSTGTSSYSNYDALQIDAEFVTNGDRVTWVHEELPSGNLVKEATDKGVGVIIRAEDQAAADRMRANMKRAKMSDADIAKVEIIIESDLDRFEDQVLSRYAPEPEPKP